MENKKIIICTTFRDFKGSENDNIQRLFLKSIENQTYKNFVLVVTLFGEKNVQEVVKEYKFDSIFIESSPPNGHRYSLTDVVLNGINYSKKFDDFAFIWCTCDIVLDNHFLALIADSCNKNYIGTSHPHLTYTSINDFENKNTPSQREISSGFDLLFFDKNFILNTDVLHSINKYRNVDWGVYEMFLISTNQLVKKSRMINIVEKAKIFKIENDRVLTNESKKFLRRSYLINHKTLERFFNDKSISKYYFILSYCNFSFSKSNFNVSYYLKNFKSLLKLVHKLFFFKKHYNSQKSLWKD